MEKARYSGKGELPLQKAFGDMHAQNMGEKKKTFWLFSVIFLVFHFCLVTIFNQRECVRSTLAWVQERMDVYLRNKNIAKATYNLFNIINLTC